MIKSVPIAAWVILLAAGVFAVQYLLLLFRFRRHRQDNDAAEQRLVTLVSALKRYAENNGRRLPARLIDIGWPDRMGVEYRPVDRIDRDPRLVLVHDSGPDRKILEFPVLRDGRGVVFCSGRLRVVSEDAFHKLLAADDALRGRLGLPAVTAGTEQTADAHERGAGPERVAFPVTADAERREQANG